MYKFYKQTLLLMAFKQRVNEWAERERERERERLKDGINSKCFIKKRFSLKRSLMSAKERQVSDKYCITRKISFKKKTFLFPKK